MRNYTDMHKNIDTTKQIQSLDDFGTPSKIIELLPPNKKQERKISSIVNYIVNIYKDQLILPRYINRARNSITRYCLKKKSPKTQSIVLYGPEPIHFFFKSFEELMSTNRNIICPNMIKPEGSIRHQSISSDLEPKQQKMFPTIKKLLNESRYLYKKGSNTKLVSELNHAYKKPRFKINDITVFEGGIFEGRIEVVDLHFYKGGTKGSTLLEEIDYFI